MSDSPTGGVAGPDGEGAEHERPVVRDKRRFDPETGERRADVPGAAASTADPLAQAEAAVQGASADLAAELTEDLQRLQAEFANYRRRVERDREAVGEAALASVMFGLLSVLDDIDRARAHGEVEGGFALVADGLEATLAKLGLTRFGDAGEPFDPTVHEALTHGHSADVTEAVCAEIYQPGYRVGERVLRPARVAVLEPEASGTTNDN
ncbi:MAG TPA: nucleotide exchange factor GrpE [Mycobacteriales bacterium]|nr:nucleotide exchange factor GrpE [Mycobacteriales bacterium]